jgi:Uma2 family endonuclease
MAERTPRRTEIDFDKEAYEYSCRLPLEHFMESVPQATQRKIFVVALDLVHAQRPDVQAFNELLVQWVRKGHRKLGQVVPDNMVVVCDEPIRATTSYDLSEQPAKPFWVLEYVSKNNTRKDYEDSFDKYEKELRVPYYLMFHPDEQELTLYKYSGKKYVALVPDKQGRLAIPKLEMEVGLLDGWVRFWFRSKLLPLPAEMQRELNETQQALDKTRQERDAALEEVERLRQEVARLRGEQG